MRPQIVELRRVFFNRPTSCSAEFVRRLRPSQGLGSPCISHNTRFFVTMGKRKNHSSVAQTISGSTLPVSIPQLDNEPPAKRRASQRKALQSNVKPLRMNPDQDTNILDGAAAWRASPDADEYDERMNVENAGMNALEQIKEEEGRSPLANDNGSDSSLSDLPEIESPIKTGRKEPRKATVVEAEAISNRAKSGKKVSSHTADEEKEVTKAAQFFNPEADGEEEPDEEELQAALSRPPPVNSDYLPLPWKGRLGYACLCTYLRFSNPPVFSSRTCRIASILENRHPLKYPNEPPHATKNRPDKEQPASIARGQKYVESLGLANARDIPKMLRWNDRYGIKFLRLSSEMFPFASHEEYGYKLAPFASEALADAGRVAAELGHRLTTHPGQVCLRGIWRLLVSADTFQFTQLGSPRQQVIDNAIRDLEYHAELLSLLKLPPQQDRDAVMILHLGGVFGDKAATLDRFRENYKNLSQDIKKRLVLENDDVSWSVHDLLPVCEELNIPMVLDFHHHNIIFDADKIREGTKDIVELFPRILATWERKKITPKMHYSEPTPSAITGRQRRKHNPRVATLPPCPPTMDLMIEAKDKEQAVFELMRTFKLPGFDKINDIIPHVRKDDNKPIRTPKKKTTPKKTKKAKTDAEENNDENDPETPLNSQDPITQPIIPDDDIGMGGPEGRVYWPPGMEHWLRPMKKVVKPNDSPSSSSLKNTPSKDPPSARKRKAAAEASKAAIQLEDELHHDDDDGAAGGGALATPSKSKSSNKATPKQRKGKAKAKAKAKAPPASKKAAKSVLTPSTFDEDEAEDAGIEEAKDEAKETTTQRRSSARARAKKTKVSYAEEDPAEDEDGEE